MEAIRSSETSVQSTKSTRHHTPEDGILHSHRRENLKSYIRRRCLRKELQFILVRYVCPSAGFIVVTTARRKGEGMFWKCPLPISVCLWLYSPFVGPWPLFQFLNLYTDGRTPWTGDQPVARPLPTHKTTQTQNKRTQTSMPWVGFEHTIPALDRAKTLHVSDRAATVIGANHR
jgi:hypothetical protein